MKIYNNWRNNKQYVLLLIRLLISFFNTHIESVRFDPNNTVKDHETLYLLIQLNLKDLQRDKLVARSFRGGIWDIQVSVKTALGESASLATLIGFLLTLYPVSHLEKTV